MKMLLALLIVLTVTTTNIVEGSCEDTKRTLYDKLIIEEVLPKYSVDVYPGEDFGIDKNYTCLSFYEESNKYYLPSDDPSVLEQTPPNSTEMYPSTARTLFNMLEYDHQHFVEIYKTTNEGFLSEFRSAFKSFDKLMDDSDVEYPIKTSCPIGLFADWACISFLVQDEKCTNENLKVPDSYKNWPSVFRFLCQDDFDALLNVCVRERFHEDFKDYFKEIVNNSTCGKINFIYHGQTSLGDVNTTIREPQSWKALMWGGAVEISDNPTRIKSHRNVNAKALVSFMGKYFPVCGKNWTLQNAEVFCRDLGNQAGEEWIAQNFSTVKDSDDARYLFGVNCSGNEKQFVYCKNDGWDYDNGDCDDTSATVTCIRVIEPTPDSNFAIWIVLGVICLLLLVLVGIVIAARVLRVKRNSAENGVLSKPIPTEGSSAASSVQHNPAIDDFSTTHEINWGSVTVSCETYGNLPKSVDGKILKVFRMPDPSCKTYRGSVVLFEPYTAGNERFVCKSYEINPNATISEQKFLKDAEHDNIVKMIEEAQTIRGKLPEESSNMMSEFNSNVMVLEYLPLGDFCTFVQSEGPGPGGQGHYLSVNDVDSMIRGACSAIKYLHNKGYAHGDISSDNFFVSSTTASPPLGVKLGDFETIRSKDSTDYDKVCTARFASPELILFAAKENTTFGEEPGWARCLPTQVDLQGNDVWGLGLFLWEVASWLTCRANTTTKINGNDDETKTMTVGSMSVLQSQTEQYLLSVFHWEQFNQHVKCHKNKHLALYERLMTFQGTSESPSTEDNPRCTVMSMYYQSMYPDSISRFSISPKLDTMLGWKASDLIKGCLEVKSENRLTADKFSAYYEMARTDIEEMNLPDETRLLPYFKGQIGKKNDSKGKRKKRRKCWEGSPTDDVEMV